MPDKSENHTRRSSASSGRRRSALDRRSGEFYYSSHGYVRSDAGIAVDITDKGTLKNRSACSGRLIDQSSDENPGRHLETMLFLDVK